MTWRVSIGLACQAISAGHCIARIMRDEILVARTETHRVMWMPSSFDEFQNIMGAIKNAQIAESN
ncbi:hypothetical protein Brsp06_03289 [Brucella sp. NBRC 13694]|jgi:hypothetical protein